MLRRDALQDFVEVVDDLVGELTLEKTGQQHETRKVDIRSCKWNSSSPTNCGMKGRGASLASCNTISCVLLLLYFIENIRNVRKSYCKMEYDAQT